MKILLALLVLVPQTGKKDLKRSCDRMERLKSYHFLVTLETNGEKKTIMEGDYFAPDAVHLKIGEVEAARKGDKTLVKKGDAWEEPKPRAGKKEPSELKLPHDWVRKMVEGIPELKREKSTKLDGVTVDIYVHSLLHGAARKAFEGGGMPLIGSGFDWSKTTNGALFYVDRSDLFRKVELRTKGIGLGRKPFSRVVEITFSNLNRVRCRLPKEVRRELGFK
jgi:hypothetical protein